MMVLDVFGIQTKSRCIYKFFTLVSSFMKIRYSRRGFQIEMHPAVNSLFGRIVLDGEVWCGRGLFLETQMLTYLYTIEEMNWVLFRYFTFAFLLYYFLIQHPLPNRVVCFDEASQQMSNQPFESRYALLLSHFHASHPTVVSLLTIWHVLFYFIRY
jgi:hypothetical protein